MHNGIGTRPFLERLLAQARRELRKREPPPGGERDCRSRRGRSMAIVVNSLLSEPRAKLLMEAIYNNGAAARSTFNAMEHVEARSAIPL